MDRQTEFIISGVGGQGMILCGTILAEAAVLHDGKLATLSSEYGVETRGTFAKSDVIVSAQPIYFPNVTRPDYVVCFAQVAYDAYADRLPEGALLLYNADEVTPRAPDTPGEVGVALSALAREAGHPATANIVSVGLLAGLSGSVSAAAARETIRRFFVRRGEKILAMNHRAFDTGYALGQSLQHTRTRRAAP